MVSGRIVPLTIFLFLIPFISVSTSAQPKYIEITANRVNIRGGPSASSLIVAKARKGDIFGLHGKEGKWYKIRMFSVNWRYVHKSLARVTPYVVSAPEQVSTRRKIFRALGRAEDRAEAEADRKYPLENRYGRPISGSVKKNIDYMWLLSDRYKLEVMHRFKVQSPIHRIIIGEGVKRNW